eukprot:13982866-Ditylum_brightwellii.AAC.2
MCDVGGDGPMLLPKRNGNPHDKQLLFAKEDLSELYFDIIGDIDANDANYDPDIRYLISYHNNNKTKQAYINHEDQSKDFYMSCKCHGFNKPKKVRNFLNEYVKNTVLAEYGQFILLQIICSNATAVLT